MNLLEKFNNYNLDDIYEHISSKQEEHLILEFKTVNFPDYNNDGKGKVFDKKNLAKVLSGFANSQGGIVVWGIKASKNEDNQDVASNKKPIRELKRFLNFLNTLEGEAISPSLSGIMHKIIEESNDVGYAVTYVPASNNPPHMAMFGEKAYYKRSGDSFYTCEHFDIRDMFFRSQSPILKFFFNQEFTKEDRGSSFEYTFKFGISNESNVLAKHVSLEMKINHPYCFSEFGLDGNKNRGLIITKRGTIQQSYSSDGTTVIHSMMLHDVDKIHVLFPKNDPDIQDLSIEYILVAEGMPRIDKKIIVPIKEIITNKFK